MGHGVVADEVAGCGDGSGKVGTLADEATDEEEGGVDLVAGEDFEEAFGGGGVGTVVVGEGDLVGIGARSEDFAEDLGVRPEGGVGGCSGEKSGCCEDGGGFGDGLGCGHGLIEGSNARSLRGYPPPGTLGLSYLFTAIYAVLLRQSRASKRVTAKVVFRKELGSKLRREFLSISSRFLSCFYCSYLEETNPPTFGRKRSLCKVLCL